MPILDPFKIDAFNMKEMTDAVNRIPNLYGRINELNLFPNRGVSTRSVVIEEKNGVLNLLPTRAPGSPGTVGKSGKRVARGFVIPHIPHDDVVMPDEIQGIRRFGSENALETVIAKVGEKLADMRNKHDITLEHLRAGALRGIVLDSDGTTLYSWFTEFDISAKTVNFELTTDSTEVLLKCMEVRDHIETKLQGETMTDIHCLCSKEFFKSLVTHPIVKSAYSRFQDGLVLRSDSRKRFEFGDIVFEQYLGEATEEDGTARRFMLANEAYFFPLGTVSTFRTLNAPADFNETVNTLGLPLYARQEPRKFGRGMDLHTQSNPLPICMRPEVLVKGTRS